MSQVIKAGACALVAGVLVSVAGAATTMRLQVSPAGAETWSSSLNAKPGDAVDIRVTVSYTGDANPLGLSSTIFQPTVSNWKVGVGGDVCAPFVGTGSNTTTPGAVPDAPGQYGRISPYAGFNLTSTMRLFAHVHAAGGITGGVSYLRIAQAQVTSWIGGAGNTSGGSGVNIKQLNINSSGRVSTGQPPFSSQLTDVAIFKFKIVLSMDPADRTLVVDAPLAAIFGVGTASGPYVGWYANPNEETPSIREVPTIERGFISVPGPGVMGVGAMALMCVGRRRGW